MNNSLYRLFRKVQPSTLTKRLNRIVSFSNDTTLPVTLDWNEGMEVVRKLEAKYPLEKVNVSELYPKLVTAQPTYNLAPIINYNVALQKLVDLGVDLSHWEKTGYLDLALRLQNWNNDVKPYVKFFLRNGVKSTDLSSILTNNPLIFEQDLDHMNSRIEYLKSKNFTGRMISQILTKSGKWILFTCEEIDGRLGYFQQTFKLSGNQVRVLSADFPSLITWNGIPTQIRENLFALTEVMGFNESEIRKMLFRCPELFRERHEARMTEHFNYLHNVIGYPHTLLSKLPECLLGKTRITEERHLFLSYIGRAQYDPKLPNYVSPTALTLDSDENFCESVAKVDIKLYDKFLKTL